MKRLLSIGIILLFIGMSISSSMGFNVEKQSIKTINGKTLYVGGSGPGNYSKIQDAIDDASDGDTVFVYSGTYYESVLVDKSINLYGEDKNLTIMDCKQDENVIRIKKDNVKISDFTIKNTFSGSSFKDGIYTRDAKNIIITNCKIVNNQMEGIYVRDSKNITISYNLINSNDHYGIGFDDTDDIFIIGNEILNNPSHGICLDYCSNIIIDNNNISSNGAIGILFSSVVTSSKIRNNVIANNNADGIFLQDRCYNANITGNIILYNGERGILITDGSHNATISNNIVMGGGIRVKANFAIISENMIVTQLRECIYIGNALKNISYYNNTIVDNILRSNFSGITIEKSHFNYISGNDIDAGGPRNHGILLTDSKRSRVTRNIIKDCIFGVVMINGKNTIITENTISSSVSGIFLWGWPNSRNCSLNIISRNNISSEDLSIFLDKASLNNIFENNFYSNSLPAYFFGSLNKWSRNYWNEPRIFPKIILGQIKIGSKWIPWINIDFRPAQEPYDIEV